MISHAAGVGVCIPVLDERGGLESLLARIDAALAGTAHTICFVDGGSTDGTREAIRETMETCPRVHLIEDPRQGSGCRRGRSSRRGLQWLVRNTAHGAFVDLDADGSQRPEELPVGLGCLRAGPASVVIASKYVRGAAVVGRPLGRRAGSRAYNLLLRLLIRPDVRDYSNSLRFYTRPAAELLLRFPVRHPGPVHLLEMMAIWLAHGLVIQEYPTRYDPRAGGASKVVPLDFLRGLAGALDVGWGYRTGRYRC